MNTKIFNKTLDRTLILSIFITMSSLTIPNQILEICMKGGEKNG